MFEPVLTMTDFYDGPVEGIAELDGLPYAYRRRTQPDVGPAAYELRRVDVETLALAVEDWERWLRWERAFQAGETSLTTHPALPAERARHDEVAPQLAARLAALPGPPAWATGEFRRAASAGAGMEVAWTRLPTPPDDVVADDDLSDG